MSSNILACETQVCEARPATVLEQLHGKRERAVQQLAEIDAAIELFNKHPEVEQCLTQLARCGIYR
jgi:hypothetical protein